MLPGFRFLFAAIMLSMSLLIFGLGAAALLRAAHESFASNSSWRGAPEVTFAQRNDAMVSVLATLSVEPAAEKPAEAAMVIAAPVEPVPTPVESVSHDQVAALSPVETPPAETTKPDDEPAQMVVSETPSAPAAAPAIAEAATTGETKTAAITASDVSSESREPAVPQSEPAGPPPATTVAAPTETAEPNVTATNLAATKIATLGGPPVDIAVKDRTTRRERATDDQSGVKKRVHARRIGHRRRLAARALLAAQQLQQQQANPFAPPAVTPATTRQRQPQ